MVWSMMGEIEASASQSAYRSWTRSRPMLVARSPLHSMTSGQNVQYLVYTRLSSRSVSEWCYPVSCFDRWRISVVLSLLTVTNSAPKRL